MILHVQKTEQQLMVVHILALATYIHIVPRFSFRPASNLTVCSTFVVKSALPIEVTFVSPVAIQIEP